MIRTPLSVLLKDKESKIYSITPAGSCLDCANTLNKLGIGALLVIEKDELKGIISERDLIRKVVSKKIEPSSIKINEVMTKDPLTVLPTTTVQEAMKIITEKRFRHLPVVENGKLIGMISIGDLTRWVMLEQEYEIASLTGYIQGGR